MDIGAIGKMLGMARGQENLDQGGAQGADKHGAEQGKVDPNVLMKHLEMLTKGGGGAQGGGGSEGSADSGGAGGQMDPEMLQKMMAGRQGMEAMMPESDNNRPIEMNS